MATLSESLGLQSHGRSISLPSRLQHPTAIKIESHLNKLKPFEPFSPSISHPLTLDVIQSGLLGLVESYNCVQELMGSPTTQAAFINHQHANVVEDQALDRSVEVLDSCASIRDMCLMIKEHVQVLQSALRRKNGDSSIESDIKAYFCFSKKVKKEATKKLRIMKQMESKFSSYFTLNMDHHLAMLFRVLREVTVITIGVLRSVLMFISSQDSRFKHGGWSLISKVMLKKQADPKNGRFFADVEGVDLALAAILENLRSPAASKDHAQIAKRRLESFNFSIEGLENGLECLFRQLLSSRVTLLNILNC